MLFLHKTMVCILVQHRMNLDLIVKVLKLYKQVRLMFVSCMRKDILSAKVLLYVVAPTLVPYL